MKKTSSRMIRINDEIRKELSLIILNHLKDPRIHAMTSVTSVDTTSDLKYCKVFVSVLGSEKEQEDTLVGLRRAASFMRSELAKNVNLRNTPELSFHKDQSIERSIHMSKLIDDVVTKDELGESREE